MPRSCSRHISTSKKRKKKGLVSSKTERHDLHTCWVKLACPLIKLPGPFIVPFFEWLYFMGQLGWCYFQSHGASFRCCPTGLPLVPASGLFLLPLVDQVYVCRTWRSLLEYIMSAGGVQKGLFVCVTCVCHCVCT